MGSVEKQPHQALLVIAHPGHELRLYGWLRKVRPLIAILTDGSGSTGISRMDLSRDLCESLGGEIIVPGRFVESDFYALVLRGETAPFAAFARELARIIDERRIDVVVCDSVEGYHPAHDLCLPLTQAALTLSTTASPERTRHLEYRVVGRPRGADEPGAEWAVELDEATFRDKIEHSRRYAEASGSVLAQEVEYMFDTYGEEAFRQEVLQRAGSEQPRLYDGMRYFEMRGEQQVRAGRYRSVLRHAEHLRPIEAALCARP